LKRYQLKSHFNPPVANSLRYAGVFGLASNVAPGLRENISTIHRAGVVSGWRLIPALFHNRDLSDSIKLLRFLGIARDILRGDLAQKDHQIIGAFRISALHQEPLDLAGPEIERCSKYLGRKTSMIDLRLELAALVS
jgi:hypothetical protein